MDDNQPVVYSPEDGETLRQYLQRYTHEEAQQIFELHETLIQFSTVLLGTHWPAEEVEENVERGLQNLWDILKRMDNYDLLLYHINMLEPIRQRLLNLLANNANELNIVSKWCTVGRFVGCTVDSLSTVAGLCLAEPESKFANIAFRIATSFGCLGIASTLTEMKISKDTFYDLMKQVQRDQDQFAPIQTWYQQSSELERAMKNIFPFDLTSKIVKEFSDIGENEFSPVRLLSTLLLAAVENDRTSLENQGLIRNLVRFTSCSSAQELCEWLIFRRQHPVILDATRMMLQLYYSPLRFLVCQSVRALAPGHQNIYSIPVWGRIALNTVSIFDAVSCLWRSEVYGAHEMRRLEQHLKSELDALKRIVNFIQSKRSSRFSDLNVRDVVRNRYST